ncbi:hypothetical protein ACQE98_09720 [Ornithinimicrobium sp. W1679]|uniref:hypothetical protein n=1 Tax=Ornithinimicrobium sp. W1679 TaxID=3418770 RepID=UPI003CF76510
MSAPTTVAPTTDEAPETMEAETEAAVTSSSPAPTLSAQEQDEADIEDTLQAYNTALGHAVVGEGSVEGIYPYSRDTAREQWVTQVMANEAQGITFSGSSTLNVLEVSIDGDTAEAVACADVSGVEAVDSNGDSYITEDRLDQTLNDFVLERDDSAELGWYVVEDTNRNEPCEG